MRIGSAVLIIYSFQLCEHWLFCAHLSIFFLGMATSKRGCWADETVEPLRKLQSPEFTVALVGLFNCYLSEKQLGCSRRRAGQTVVDALGLDGKQWPAFLNHWRFIDHREMAIPLQPGISLESRSSQSLICQLVLCELKNGWEERKPLLGGAASKGPLSGFRRNIVKVFSVPASSTLLRDLARSSLSVDDVMILKEHAADVLSGLACLASSQLQEIKEHQQQRFESTGHRPGKKPYERETERANELLRNVQRVKTTILEGRSDLSELPLQLGFADVPQWMNSGDFCRTSGPNCRLHDFLGSICKCGLMSWKIRRAGDVLLTGDIPSSEWVPILIHMMKEQVMQRFFRGGVFLDEMGMAETIKPAPGKKNPSFSVVQLEDEPKSCPQSIRHHICWVIPAAMGSSHRLLEFMLEAHQIPSVAQQQKTLQALTLATARFQLALKWEGVGRQVLRFHGIVPEGRVRVLVGEYSGAEHYTIAALQTARAKQDLTPAFHGIFGAFSRSICMNSSDANPFLPLSVEKVDAVMSRQSLRLSSDQKDLVDFFRGVTGGCAGVDAVAGGGKTVTMTACEMALMEEELAPHERLVHVVKSRKGRHAHLQVARKFAKKTLRSP